MQFVRKIKFGSTGPLLCIESFQNIVISGRKWRSRNPEFVYIPMESLFGVVRPVTFEKKKKKSLYQRSSSLGNVFFRKKKEKNRKKMAICIVLQEQQGLFIRCGSIASRSVKSLYFAIVFLQIF